MFEVLSWTFGIYLDCPSVPERECVSIAVQGGSCDLGYLLRTVQNSGAREPKHAALSDAVTVAIHLVTVRGRKSQSLCPRRGLNPRLHWAKA